MISIDKYEIINNADGSQVFKLDYSNKGSESIRVKIVMNDLLFRTQNYNIGFHDIHPNCGHWSTFNSFDTGLTTQFSMYSYHFNEPEQVYDESRLTYELFDSLNLHKIFSNYLPKADVRDSVIDDILN